MGIATGTVVASEVEVGEVDLPEGATVPILIPEPNEEVIQSAEEQATLLEGMVEADRGETDP